MENQTGARKSKKLFKYLNKPHFSFFFFFFIHRIHHFSRHQWLASQVNSNRILCFCNILQPKAFSSSHFYFICTVSLSSISLHQEGNLPTLSSP